MIGRTLSHYRILEKLGSGGMGDVYLTEDTKLKRKVALKVLPAQLAESEERRARFKREAQAIAALNHPNIVHVYSVEEAEGVHFITMELVRGKTVAELLPKHGFSLVKFFDMAVPLSDAVAAAHQQGITHRDLKPENVMLSDEGRLKVLDFGLARAEHEPTSEGAASGLPTATRTREGTIVGTVSYMSPEQAEGKAVDHRSDIFSLGILFYEMLSGRRPFRGETPTAILSSILKDTPASLMELNPDTPRELSKMVQRCLAKEPSRRIQSALDIRNGLEELRAEWSSGKLEESTSRRSHAINKWLLVATVTTLLALVAVLFYRREPTALRLINPVQITSAVGVENYPTWSPDGGRLAYESNQGGNWDIWVAQPGGQEPVNLTADHSGPDRSPSWSPDGRQIAFLSRREETWGLYLLSALGGRPRQVISSLPLVFSEPLGAPQWSADGREIAVPVFLSGQGYVEFVNLESQKSRRMALGQHRGNPCYDLRWSPDGETLAYVDAAYFIAQVTQLWMLPSSGGEPLPVTDGRTSVWSPLWSADGRRLFFVSNRGGSMDLWQQRVADGKPEGGPEPVTTGLGIRSAAFSSDGAKLAYSLGRPVSNLWRVPILRDRRATWADAEQLTFDSALIECVDVSPDGKRLAISSDRGGNVDVWILPSGGGEMTQLTADPTPDWCPQWSPDGEEVVFHAYRSGNRDIWATPIRGGPARQLTYHPAEDAAPTWSPDGRQVAFASRRQGSRDVWTVDANGGQARPLTVGQTADSPPTWSPDGSWIVFESGRRLFRIPAVGGEPEILSEQGGYAPRWSPDGKVLYFPGAAERAGNLWALSLEDRREYPITDLAGRRGSLQYGLATDGKYLYFLWWEDVGDIWVMDVAR